MSGEPGPAEGRCSAATVKKWMPLAACFVADESGRPPIIRHVVRKTCCCCGGCLFFMILTVFLAVAAVGAQEEDFPTTDSTGFRDRADITSLSMDAVTLVHDLKDAAAKSSTEGMVCTTNRGGEETCEVDADLPPNSKAERRWGVTLMFKRKDNKNIMTPSILEHIKTKIVDKIISTPDYDKFCLKWGLALSLPVRVHSYCCV